MSSAGSFWRNKTISRRTLARAVAAESLTAEEEAAFADLDAARPRVRADCEGGPRPCPFVSCRYHLYLDVTATGGVKLNYPEREVWELEHTCALDLADQGGLTLEAVGAALQLTRERVRKLELATAAKVRAAGIGL